MDRNGVIDYCTIYRSVKKQNYNKVIGRHGIGKLSVAAMPGQCGFEMTTSTGFECWRLKAGNLLNDEAIKIESIEPVIPKSGTIIAITFTKSDSVKNEVNQLADILDRYVRYLPIKIYLLELKGEKLDSPELAVIIRVISGEWTSITERFGRFYDFVLQGIRYQSVIGLGTNIYEIYQNRVLVTNKYNLFSFDLRNDFKIPHIQVRVDSKDFELPFGRHKLRNEEVLIALAKYLREKILPQYLARLFQVKIIWMLTKLLQS